ncbi:MAG: cytochrome-c oxidase, cbb3-type subunit I [Alphaproteobacteria bacterium HGW-Alphaproteobacteria-16]|nr:MAG: cytochrome-c oxidase, cbb3-type subunit I [Alphaproteobacteria bacterium HGW-Alphaproteobacteria-16]
MDDAVTRSFAWLLLGILAILLIPLAADTGFAVHLGIAAGTALFLGWRAMNQVDAPPAPKPSQASYDDDLIRYGTIATVFWGVVGFLVGLYIALQLAFPALNLGLEYTTFGRLRPLHTSAVIFAFGGNALIATSFYVVQRTCRARLAFPALARFVFWGYQFFIVLAATGYVLGITQAREYAEPEWYVDLWLTAVWVAYLAVFVGTIVKRREPHIYVANWFFLAFIITVAMLHLVNNLAMPVSLLGAKSYSAFAGVQDALTQWWYGHNAVGFFLTAGFLGMMYYFVPKQAERPIYSYRLSIIHFWSLIFLYIWAGPHHLHYTALPDWAQTLGMVFSIMLWMPSWGGMINGLMTLSGAWDKIRTDPIIRMMVLAIAFYGMATFEGPLMSIKSVNSLSHYTDWTIGHVHSGALGWNGMITFAAIYFMVPRLWKRERLYSLRMINWHFWCATAGIVLYASAMWVAGIMQGLMWREYGADGYLVYSFAEVVGAMQPYYLIRAAGGSLYLLGAFFMVWNIWMTVKGKLRDEAPLTDASYDAAADRPLPPHAVPAA